MSGKAVTVEQAVKLLNEALEADQVAISTLVATHALCNTEIVNHPTIQVGEHCNSPSVGLLGIINGIFGTVVGGKLDGYGFIVAIFEHGKLVGFKSIEEVSAEIAADIEADQTKE